jgi:hypothetical protein
MSNFFAQADALAAGKTAEEVAAEGAPPGLVPHKVFPGNRPSTSLLLPRLDAYTAGQLLALYEHRTGKCAVDGWGRGRGDGAGRGGGVVSLVGCAQALRVTGSTHLYARRPPPTPCLVVLFPRSGARLCVEHPVV